MGGKISKALDKLNIIPFLFVHAVSHLLSFQLETFYLLFFTKENKTKTNHLTNVKNTLKSTVDCEHI